MLQVYFSASTVDMWRYVKLLSRFPRYTYFFQNKDDDTIMSGYWKVALAEEFIGTLQQVHSKDGLHADLGQHSPGYASYIFSHI